MQLIGTQFIVSDIFNKCSYWTLNRALLKNDPNNSFVVNPTYAMTEDDRELFFNDYFTTACCDLSQILIYYRHKLFVNNVPANSVNAIDININGNFVIFYLFVSETFPSDIFMPLAERFLQFSVLYYWYWLKNFYEEREYCRLELERIKTSILNIKNEFANDNQARQIYNNGFTINPTRKQNKCLQELTPVIIGNPVPEIIDEIPDTNNPPVMPPVTDVVNDKIFSVEFDEQFT